MKLRSIQFALICALCGLAPASAREVAIQGDLMAEPHGQPFKTHLVELVEENKFSDALQLLQHWTGATPQELHVTRAIIYLKWFEHDERVIVGEAFRKYGGSFRTSGCQFEGEPDDSLPEKLLSAFKELQHVLNEPEPPATAYFLMAKINADGDHRAKAFRDITMAIKREPNEPEYHFWRAFFLYENAFSLYDEASLKIVPEDLVPLMDDILLQRPNSSWFSSKLSLHDVDKALELDSAEPEYHLLKADLLVAMKRQKEALEAVSAGLARLPENVELLEKSRDLRIESKDFRGAFNDQMKIDQMTKRDNRSEKIRLLMDAKDFKSAWYYANSIKDPVERNSWLALVAYREGDFAKAIEIWSRAPSPPWSKVAASYFALGKAPDAVQAWEKYLKAAPPHRMIATDSYYRMALAYEKAGNYAKALSFCQKAHDSIPFYESDDRTAKAEVTYAKINQLLRRLRVLAHEPILLEKERFGIFSGPNWKTKTAQDLVERMKTGVFDQAIAALSDDEKLKTGDPNYVVSLESLRILKMRDAKDRYPEVVSSYRERDKIGTDSQQIIDKLNGIKSGDKFFDQACILKAWIYRDNARNALAFDELSEAAKANSSDWRVYLERAKLLSREFVDTPVGVPKEIGDENREVFKRVFHTRTNEDAMMGDLNKALSLNPNSIEALDMRATENRLSHKSKERIVDISKLISLSGSHPRLLIQRAEEYERLGKFEQALNDLNAAIAMRNSDRSDGWGDDDEYLYAKARVLARMRRFDAAVAICNKLLRSTVHFRVEQAWLLMGDMNIMQGNVDKAIALWKKSDRNIDADRLAYAAQLKKDYKESIKQWRAFLGAGTGPFVVYGPYFYLSRALSATRQAQDAERECERAFQLSNKPDVACWYLDRIFSEIKPTDVRDYLKELRSSRAPKAVPAGNLKKGSRGKG